VTTHIKAVVPRMTRRSARALVVFALVIAAGVTILLGAVAWSHRTPAWWKPLAMSSQLREQGESFEHAVIAQATRVCDEQPWRVSLTESDLNAWLGTRLESWLAHRGIDHNQVDRVHLDCTDTGILLGASIKNQENTSSRATSVIWARLAPSIREGDLWLGVREARLGGMPIDNKLVARLLPGLPESAHNALFAQSPLAHASWPLGDGRTLRLIEVTSHEDRLELTLLTKKGETVATPMVLGR
jgi:hypothetical protein